MESTNPNIDRAKVFKLNNERYIQRGDYLVEMSSIVIAIVVVALIAGALMIFTSPQGTNFFLSASGYSAGSGYSQGTTCSADQQAAYASTACIPDGGGCCNGQQDTPCGKRDCPSCCGGGCYGGSCKTCTSGACPPGSPPCCGTLECMNGQCK